MAETSIPVTVHPFQSPVPLYYVVPKTSLYVGDLHPQVKESDLIQKFERFGLLHSVHVCRARDSSKPLCYGFVNFWNSFDASRALARLNHTELKGKAMRIMWSERDPTRRNNSNANLYVKNMDESVTSAQLEAMFGKYGTILSCKVAEKFGKSIGFGFVQFESEDSAKAAVNALNGFMLKGKKLYVSKFVKKSERNDTSTELFSNVYVSNLDKDISEGILRDKFSEYGRVSKVVVIRDSEGISKGYGFVQFDSEIEAMKAIGFMNGALIGSRNVYVAMAQKTKEKPKAVKPANELAVYNTSEKPKALTLYAKNLISDTFNNRQFSRSLLSNEQSYCRLNWNASYDHIYYETVYKSWNAYVNPDVYKNFSKPIAAYCQLKNPPKNCSSFQDRRSGYAFLHGQTCGTWKQQKPFNKSGSRVTGYGV